MDNAEQPLPSLSAVMAQLLVFATSPADQRLADMPFDGPERRRHETPVVVEPSPKFGIDHPRQILDGLRRAAMQLPSSNLVTDFLGRILRDCRTETAKDRPSPTVRFPRTKGEPQKVELLLRVSLSPVRILAVDHFRLLRM